MKQIAAGKIPSVAESSKVDERVLKKLAELHKVAALLLDEIARLEELVAHGQTSTKALVVQFVAAWERTTGDTYSPPHGAAADTRAFRQLMKTHSAEQIRARMETFFTKSDAWTRQHGYPVAAFVKQFNALGMRESDRPSREPDVQDFFR